MMKVLVLLIFVFALSGVVDAERVYKHSRVVNGKIVTDYTYENMPEKKPEGRAYREGGKIKYEGQDEDVRKGKAYREDGRIKYH